MKNKFCIMVSFIQNQIVYHFVFQSEPAMKSN